MKYFLKISLIYADSSLALLLNILTRKITSINPVNKGYQIINPTFSPAIAAGISITFKKLKTINT